MNENDRSSAVVPMAISPLHERDQYAGKVAPCVGKPILVTARALAVADLLEYAVFDEAIEPNRQQV